MKKPVKNFREIARIALVSVRGGADQVAAFVPAEPPVVGQIGKVKYEEIRVDPPTHF